MIFLSQESLKAALKQAEDRLEEDKTAVKAQKRESKVCISYFWDSLGILHTFKILLRFFFKNEGLSKSDIFQVKKEVEVDNATRRKAARKVC